MAKGSNGGTLWMSRSYAVVDRDPEIEKFQTLWSKERIKESDLAVLAGLSASTVANMFTKGTTRRPQHATFAKMAAAMGYEYTVAREEKPNYDREIPVAREQYKQHKERLARSRKRKEAKS
jgi:transcriptional regulator with XRE-family HTH domain